MRVVMSISLSVSDKIKRVCEYFGLMVVRV